MKQSLLITFIFLTIATFGQDFPFIKDFKSGTIIQTNGTSKTGFIKWNTNQNERLRFKEAGSDEVTKYSPLELVGFTVDTLHYKSLFDIEVYAENYPLLNKTSVLKETFGQVLHSGKVNIYCVVAHGYEPMSGAGIFLNFLFERVTGDQKEYAAYPVGTRMKNKRYDAAKEKLYTFFADYPSVIDKIKTYKQYNDFFDVIKMVKAL